MAISYRELGALSDAVRDRLVCLGVRPRDRVGIYMRKSIDAVAAIYGVLKAGAAYVPVDPSAPAARGAFTLIDCTVRAVVVESRFEAALRSEFASVGFGAALLVSDPVGGGSGVASALANLEAQSRAPRSQSADPDGEDLAYVLYTSGSTGKPKGVSLTHANAMAFVDWCERAFSPRPDDRFSSHAPFHFDLSILDLYTPARAAATLVIVPEEIGKEPAALAKLIAEMRISVWYSAPSILALLVQFGKLDSYDYSALRTVLFAGEVFPVSHLRALTKHWPRPRYFNLYGPTETNVCTWFEVELPVPDERSDAYPIGKVCDHMEGAIVDGELVIRGGNVTQGYWNLPDQTARAFLEHDGLRWYRTGDLVVEQSDGNLRFLGRRDRMVKKRGYRIELGEIEACLYRHPNVREAAVVAIPDESVGLIVRAHIATIDGARVSLIQLKIFCSQHMPLYMVPDAFQFHDALPKTSTDKIDYQALKSLA